MCLAEANYYDLNELAIEWRVGTGKMKRWLMSGILKPHFWLPVLSVVERMPSTAKGGIGKLRHYEGFVPLSGQHCQRLFRSGKLTLRSFKGREVDHYLELPDSSDDILVQSDDLLVLDTDKASFEREYISVNDTPSIDPGFRTIRIEGETYRFGDIQSAILSTLHEAALNGEPWQNGKQLLHSVGSESFTLSNVFKHKPIWRKLIESDGRGFYRLAPEFSS